jgi:hypothetical protein
MPETLPKKWGKVDRAALQDLINDGTVDINDLSSRSIDVRRRERPQDRVQRREETAAR